MLMCGQHPGKKHVLYRVYDKATSTSPNHCATLEEKLSLTGWSVKWNNARG